MARSLQGRHVWAWVLLALLPAAADGGASPPEDPCREGGFTEHFHAALEAGRSGDLERLERREACLPSAHPLEAYLDFHRLRMGLPEADPDRVAAYQERHADSRLRAVAERMALRRYAEAERHQAVRELTQEPPRRLALRCHWWHAHLEERRSEALRFAARIWQVGESRPPACDPLFDAAREAGVIDDRAIWERLRLAYRSEDHGLFRYLKSELASERWRSAAEALERLHRDPGAVERLDSELPRAVRRALTADAVYRLARTDTVAALEALQRAGSGLPELPAGEREEVARRVVWYATIRGLSEHAGWRDRWILEHGGADLLGQRLRQAVAEQAWSDVVFWLARLPEAEQEAARWQYWHGRARAELGDRVAARRSWARAAEQREFWGLLAAQRLDRPFALNDATPEAQALEPEPGLLRVSVLRAGGELRLARREWRHLLDGASAARRCELAGHAHLQGWPDLAILAARGEGCRDALAWRFPYAHGEAFIEAADDSGVAADLLLAVARRESAFQADAASPAGARGLMQIMPATASELGQEDVEAGALEEVGTSIELGAAYLRQLLERFDGNRPLALAAYNAGPVRVEQWLHGDGPRPLDVWIASIPYHETRHYVQAVLTYRAILRARALDERRVRVLSEAELAAGYGGPRGLVEADAHPAGVLPASRLRRSGAE